MRIPRWLGITAMSASALALAAGVGFGAASASPAVPKAAVKAVSAGAAAPARKHGHAYWQGPSVYNVPTGTTNLFFHYACPSRFPTAVSGSFHYLAHPGSTPSLDMSAPRTDITPFYRQWGWVFIWPGGGAASGFQIQFNVYCLAK